MFRRLKNNRGVALLIVISFISIIIVSVVDFWSDSVLSHDLARNHGARVQSYYLAKSAINFSKLVLFYHKEIESQIKKNKLSYDQLGIEPLYRQIPINSGLLRGLLPPPGEAGEEGAGDEELAPPEPADDSEDGGGLFDEAQKTVSLLKQDELSEFLSFDGDFFADIQEEQSRYSVNAISKLTVKSQTYDLHKKVLLSILLRPEFKNFFDNQINDAEELTHAIADYIDANGMINEFGEVERGDEESLYDDDLKPKDGKMLTLSELRLVPGMSDDIYENLKPYVTVYHTDSTLSFCQAEDDVADALLIHFSRESGCTSALDPEDTEALEDIRLAAQAMCPDKNNVIEALEEAFGLNSEDRKIERDLQASCQIKLTDMISDDNSIFRIEAVGQVGTMATTITLVLDTTSSRSNSWVNLYYQVD